MNKEDLNKLKEKISKLTKEEQKLRDLYLRGLSTGEIEGPMTSYASIDKPWLKRYDKKAIDFDFPKMKTYDLLYSKWKNDQETIILNYFGNRISYKTFFKEVETIAKAMKQIGVNKGDIVSVALPTMPETVYILYALNRIGAISDFIDPRLTTDGFNKRLMSTKSKYLLALDMTNEVVSRIDSALLEKIVFLKPSESFPIGLREIYNLKNKYPKSSNKVMNWKEFKKMSLNYDGIIDTPYVPNEPFTIVHTGGTTGDPKGVLLTNENFNVMGIHQEISQLHFDKGDTFLTFLPPFIAYCLTNSFHDALYIGMENILLPSFDPKDFPKLMHKYKPNHVLSGPILWDMFIKDSKINKDDLSYMKTAISGGDSLNLELEKEIINFFKNHGARTILNQGYGMSEVSAAACYSKNNSYTLGSVGIPYPHNIIKIVDENNDELNYNSQGEIHISSDTMMKGYLNNDEATKEIIYVEDGIRWIKTGDIGYINNDGNLFVVGRMKRMIVRNGNKIFPSTVENIIAEDCDVDSVAIVGISDEVERHVPVAHIVLKENIQDIDEVLLRITNKIKEKMPEFNIPVMYILKKKLPYTNINKIDFKKLELENIDEIKESIFYTNDIINEKRKVLK